MSLQSREMIPTRTRKSGLLDEIMAKYKECSESCYLHTAINHLKTYEYYVKLMEKKGPAAFGTRIEYQKFEVAKLFIDRIHMLEFSLNASFKGYKEYKDKGMPPLDAFGMTTDVKETKKIKFCRNIEKGDILHLKVVEESDAEYKLLVINKYDENERVVDYLIHAYMVKSYQLEKLPRPMKVNDYVRAAVLGKLKMEENVFSKLLVTLNNNLVNEKYKDVKLGLIFKQDIRFYPEDISNHSSFLNYMRPEKDFDEGVTKCMTSLGVDPYKMYLFDKYRDGKKLGKAKEYDSNTMELLKMKKSMNKIKEADQQILQGIDPRAILPLTEEALEIYPQNDAAYAVRGQLMETLLPGISKLSWLKKRSGGTKRWYRLFMDKQEQDLLRKAVDDCEKALDINPYNITATRVYLSFLMLSAEVYKEEGNNEKAAMIEEILAQCKHICDVSQYWAEGDEEKDKSKQSPTGETQNGVVPMDLSAG